LVSGFDGCSDLFFFLCEGGYFMCLLFEFVAIFAVAGFGGIAFGVGSAFLVLLFDLGFEEIKRFIHVS
jgi:hypothetical protein